MLLGLVVVLALGSYLYQQIANGLVDDRIAPGPAGRAAGLTRVRPDAVRRDRQHRRHEHDPAGHRHRGPAGLAGADQSRDIILVRSGAATSPAKVPTILSGDVGLPSIPAELREAVSADPGRQKAQVISVTSEQTGEAVPAVVVGSQITLPHGRAATSCTSSSRWTGSRPPSRSSPAPSPSAASRWSCSSGPSPTWSPGSVVDPVRRAALVAERLSSGRLNERMTARGEDDIARLAAAFNGMADNLQRQIRQLENLSRVQQRFTSDVSHELRTPLTTIRMAGELLHDSRADFDPAVARGGRAAARRSSTGSRRC